MQFILRKWQKEDAPDIAVAANNPRIAQNLRNSFPYPHRLSDAEWFIEDCLRREGKNQMTRVIVVDGKAAGSIGIFRQGDVYEKSAELGYWLSEDYWRRGIMSQAVRMICREAFAAFDLRRIYAEPFDCNAASKGVLEKAGFTLEGTMRDSIYKDGRVLSSCMYSLLPWELDI